MLKYKLVASHPTLIKMSCYSQMVSFWNCELVLRLFHGLYLDRLENCPAFYINKNNEEEKNEEY